MFKKRKLLVIVGIIVAVLITLYTGVFGIAPVAQITGFPFAF